MNKFSAVNIFPFFPFVQCFTFISFDYFHFLLVKTKYRLFFFKWLTAFRFYFAYLFGGWFLAISFRFLTKGCKNRLVQVEPGGSAAWRRVHLWSFRVYGGSPLWNQRTEMQLKPFFWRKIRKQGGLNVKVTTKLFTAHSWSCVKCPFLFTLDKQGGAFFLF